MCSSDLANAWKSFYEDKKNTLDRFYTHDAGYEDAIDNVDDWMDAQPTVDAVALPCKMGDEVWGIRRNGSHGKKAVKGKVFQMFFGDDMRLCICVKGVCRGEWGKNVFATQEEAENAISTSPLGIAHKY